MQILLPPRVRVALNERPTVDNREKVVEILRDIWNEDTVEPREKFIVLLLNNAKKCMGWSRISSGGAVTIADPAAIFQVALLANAQSIILAPNHPSGNIEPSKADRELTKRIKNSGKMLGIGVEDHIILTAGSFLSFKSNNIIW